MRAEIETLVELLARAVYNRWKSGEPIPGAQPMLGEKVSIPTAIRPFEDGSLAKSSGEDSA
jgi:hypothetical protein